MSDALKSFDELTEDEKRKNREAVDDLTEGTVYRFSSPVQTIPLERRIKGVKNAGVPITFSRAMYMGWREKEQEHMFLAKTLQGNFFAPMYLCGGPLCVPDPNGTPIA